jgi:glycerol-3-phosphate dehydrogenase
LPGKALPENVVAITDVVEAAKDADILIIVIPHQVSQKSKEFLFLVSWLHKFFF